MEKNKEKKQALEEKTLERVMKKDLKPAVDEAIHKRLGLTIEELNKDITDKIETRPLISFDINTSLPFKTAKKLFKKNYLSKLIKTHYGNISEVAKIAVLDRRSIHRAIKALDIDIKKCRQDLLKPGYFRKEEMDSILKNTFDSYKNILHPAKLEEMYKNIPSLTEDILKSLPDKEISWKQAEKEFERRFLKKALNQNNFNITTTAKKIKLRYETLIRKMKALDIRD